MSLKHISSQPLHTLDRSRHSAQDGSGSTNLAHRHLSEKMSHEERRRRRRMMMRRRKRMSESRDGSHWAGKWRQEMGVKRIRSRGDHREGGVVIDIQYFCWRQRWQRGLWDGKQRNQPTADAVFIVLHAPQRPSDPQCQDHTLQRTASLTVSSYPSLTRCLFLFFIR